MRANVMPAASPALPALTWSPALAQVAQAWANNCMYAHNAGRGSNVGENIAVVAPSTFNRAPSLWVAQWSGEAVDYNYATNTCASGKSCGHYTQLVWRATTAVGCATQSCTINSPFPGFATWSFAVCDYSPAGNYIGQFPY